MDASQLVEEWRAVDGYLAYEVSNLGRVRRTLPGRKTFPGKILKPQFAGAGYQMVFLTRDGKNRARYVHRLVAAAFLTKNAETEEVNHLDGDKQNNVVTNLEWTSHRDNARHAVSIGNYRWANAHV